jgi:formylglycine-generating enzyme required for sulfatase activity
MIGTKGFMAQNATLNDERGTGNEELPGQPAVDPSFIVHRSSFIVPHWFVLLACLVSSAGCTNGTKPDAVVEAHQIISTASGIEMVVIPAGFFEMGSSRGRADEKPVHKVWVDSFLMDRTEVTQAEYEKLGKIEAFPNPSHFKGANLPVEQVSWPQAALFCNARSNLEKLKPCYNDECVCDFEADGYRLPTEAEWEYACRAGTQTDYANGNDARRLGDVAWYAENAGKKTHPVGQKKANAWGLFDMHGNVAEWCHDAFDIGYYKSSPEKNPRGPAPGKEYVLRGGSWKSSAEAARSSYRLAETPGFSDACLAKDAIGFRCVRRSDAPASRAP